MECKGQESPDPSLCRGGPSWTSNTGLWCSRASPQHPAHLRARELNPGALVKLNILHNILSSQPSNDGK
ncbi:unnamed protein product [Lota lota]